ncbi:MAG: hypothetical protein BGO59_18320 [Spirosoma sp. 48-14]|nr:MAG: hypothetical protein BGO59_18320 [Spirosoma sp. 48-14]
MTRSFIAKWFPVIQGAIILINGYFFLKYPLVSLPGVLLSLLFALLSVIYYSHNGIVIYSLRCVKSYTYQEFVSIRPYADGVNLYKIIFTDGMEYLIGNGGKYLFSIDSVQTAMNMERKLRVFFETMDSKIN